MTARLPRTRTRLRHTLLRALCRGLGAGVWIALWASAAGAQAPLVTDDTGTTPGRRLHLELFAQHARLSAAARPVTMQETLVLSAAYGATSRLELGFDLPWLDIRSDGGDAIGLGDLDFTAKLRLRDDDGGRRAAWAVTAAVELPTGDERRGLGSGARDESVGVIVQRAIGPRTSLQGNVGLQFAGNTLTGAVGTRDRAHVLSAGGSVVHVLSDRWQIEGELTGYEGRTSDAADRELRAQLGANLTLSPRLALAAAVQRGWLATPPWSLQLGLILDP